MLCQTGREQQSAEVIEEAGAGAEAGAGDGAVQGDRRHMWVVVAIPAGFRHMCVVLVHSRSS